MERSKLYIVCLSFLLTGSFVSWSQGDVNIDIKGNREVENASRIAENPKIIDTVMPSPVVDYPRMNLLYPTNLELDKIEAAGVKIIDKLPQLYRSYLRVGVGTEFMPLGEFYFNNTRSRKYHYGLHLNHLSSFGYLEDYAPASFDRTSGRLYGSILENNYTLNGQLRARNDGFHYYGFLNDSIAKDSIRQRFSDIGFNIDFAGHKRDSANLNYKLGIDFNTGLWYKWGIEIFAVDLKVQYNGYKIGIPDSTIGLDTGLINNNGVISLRPHITTFAFNNRLKAKVGFDFSVDAKAKSKAYIYPIAEAKYSLFNDIIIPYVGLSGGLKQQSYKNLSTINPFIIPSIDIRNEHKAIEFYGGIKGTVSKRIGFNLGGSFSHIKNMALFITDSLHPRMNQFTVIYDTLNKATVEASVYYQLKEKLKIDFIAKYNSYLLLNNSFAWNMPTTELTLRGKYNLFEKLVTQLDVTLLGGRRALVYSDLPNAKLENDQYSLQLGFVTDINWSVEYLYNKRISAFIQLNNAAAQRYMRWYNYPVQAFQALGGFTFKF